MDHLGHVGPDGVRIKNDHIRRHSPPDQAPVMEAPERRGVVGDLANRIFQGHGLFLPNPITQQVSLQ